MTEEEMLEAESFWCENCCNFDKEHIGPDAMAPCKITNTLAYCEESGKDCPFFNVPAADVVKVVRCRVCKRNVSNMEKDPLNSTDYSGDDIVCSYFLTDGMRPNDFCSYGERNQA